MFFQKKSRPVANVVVEDHVIRIVVTQGSPKENILLQVERTLPAGLVEEGKVVDEIGFYELMQDLVDEFSLKKMDVRFYAPNSLVMMRQIEIPDEVQDDELKAYFEMEIGITLHLPFKEPLIDVHVLEQPALEHMETGALLDVAAATEEKSPRKGLLFAASGEEVMKYTHIFEDAGMHPLAVDVQALGVYRYFYHTEKPVREKSQMFFELNLSSVNISIFYDHQLEFLRYQKLDLSSKDWTAEENEAGFLHWQIKDNQKELAEEIIAGQVEELARIMNFYRFSQHQGERQVEELIIHGDHPEIDQIAETLQLTYDLPIKVLTGWEADEQTGVNQTAFIPAFGLALKGSVD